MSFLRRSLSLRGFGCWSGVPAQTVEIPNDLRPLYATPIDVAEGKHLAESTCAGCHNLNGISPGRALRIWPGSVRLIFISAQGIQIGRA